jgi:hypothetical protein
VPFIERDLVRVSRRPTHAGVVEEQIDPAMSSDRAVEEVTYGILVSYVGRDGIKLEARMRGRELIKWRRTAASNDDLPSLGRESGCRRRSDSTAAAGYHCDLVRHSRPFAVPASPSR